jgi:hypothetical protein
LPITVVALMQNITKQYVKFNELASQPKAGKSQKFTNYEYYQAILVNFYEKDRRSVNFNL